MSYTVYTDGGCERNPGGPGGCGIVIINNESQEVNQYSIGYVSTTNNRMEMLAVHHALCNLPENPGKIDLYSDSQYVLQSLQGNWSKNKNKDLWALLDKDLAGKDIEYHWVRGHNNNQYNEICDQLATAGIKSSDKLEDPGYTVAQTAEYSAPKKNTAQQKPKAPEPKQKTQGAMSVQYSVPPMYRKHADVSVNANTYAANMNVNYPCAESIITFYRNGRGSFKAYAALKTGGMDSWSKQKKNDFLHEFGEDVWECTIDILKDTAMTERALRWYGRGLALDDAIRKVLVDAEISENAKKF